MSCRDCGHADARTSLSGVQLCDRCFDHRIAEHTGYPRLLDPPPPLELPGPDERRHRLRFRIWRAPTGIEVELEGTSAPDDEGYHFAVLGDHNADVDDLIALIRARAEREIGRTYLEPARDGHGWVLADDEVAGRLVWNDESGSGTPYDVVVDGRRLSWEEFGMALESFEGWHLRLVIEDRVEDARTDADIIDLWG